MKIVLFGATGQVGLALQDSLAGIAGLDGLVCSSRGGGRWSADFDRPVEVAQLLRMLRPDVIVNAAAWTAVDAAEDHAEAALRVNATSPGAIAIEAQKLGALLLHYSSDYVFDGSGALAWREDDPTGPLNVYGATKLAGEQAIRASGCRHLIVRTSGVWSPGGEGGNFVATVRARLLARQALRVVDDQIGAPTAAALVADLSAQLLQRALKTEAVSGTYHLAPRGETSWFAVARLIAEGLRALGAVVPEVQAVPSAAYPQRARRPLNSRLDCSRLHSALGIALADWPTWPAPILQAIAAWPAGSPAASATGS